MNSRAGNDSVILRAFPPSRVADHSEDGIRREVADSTERDLPVLDEPTRLYQLLLVLAGFNMTFHVFGTNTVYSILQEFYTSSETNINGAEGQDALVSLVGTIGSGLTWAGCIFVNPMIGHFGHIKLISFAGAFFMGLGLILASFCKELWQLYLTQGILYGIGTSMYYFPIMSVTPAYFNRNRGAAMGFVLSGSGVGGLVLSPVFNILLHRLGIQWALRVMGIWNFVMGIPVSLVLTRRHAASAGATGRSRVSMALVRRGTFVLQCVGAFLQAAGYMIPIYYLTTYSVSILAYSSGKSSTLLAINNGVNSLSRVGMGILADRVGRQNTMVLSIILTAVSVFALWYDSDRSRFTAFVVLYGILSGGYNALLPSTISELYGVQNYSSVNGVLQLVRGLGVMFGAPIAGVILGSHSRGGTPTPSRLSQILSINGLKTRYNDVVIFDGVLLLVSGICVAYVRWLDARDKGK